MGRRLERFHDVGIADETNGFGPIAYLFSLYSYKTIRAQKTEHGATYQPCGKIDISHSHIFLEHLGT